MKKLFLTLIRSITCQKDKAVVRVSGETLLEVLIAVSLISTILVGALSILNQTYASIEKTNNRIIALNLAREGIEAVRNVRDTNWVNYSGEKDDKWLCISSGCAEKVSNGDYIVKYDENNNKYSLVKIRRSYTANSNPPDDFFMIYRYIATNKLWINSENKPTNTSPTGFYRVINLKIANPLGNNAPSFCEDSTKCGKHRLKVLSTVFWTNKKHLQKVVIETNLFNYLK